MFLALLHGDSHARPRRTALAVAAGVLAAAALAGPACMAAQAANQTTFSGRATVVRANVLGVPTTLADTGPLPSSGGAQEASLLSVSQPGLLTADVLHASTVGQGSSSESEASVADLDMTVGGNHVTADFLMARSSATCSNGRASTSGSSEIAALSVNGQGVSVSGTPNQTIPLPGGGTLVINEQSSSPGSIDVSALHLTEPGVADVVISSTHADISCGSAGCGRGSDFVTGGGWITAPSGAKGTFGVGGGIKNGAFWGHLVYIDHGNGLKVKGTGVTAYTVVDSQTRHIEGTADIGGTSGTYSVDVSDRGEPGRSDTFSLKLSDGYSAGGALGGGNIKLHMPCK
jgi:hypothetical protein